MKLAAIFSDHMVLQRNKKVKIYGSSSCEECISVAIDGYVTTQTVDAGDWEIELPPHEAGGPYELSVKSASIIGVRERVIKDVLFGEVWLDNGQSNIEFELQNSLGGLKEIEDAYYPEIRYFKCIKSPVLDEKFLKEEEKLVWHKLENGDFKEMSGIAYFFATYLYKTLGIPVGIIDCYQGGTSITCWLEMDRLKCLPVAEDYLKEFTEMTSGQTDEEFEKLLNDYNCLVERHKKLAADAKAKNPNITPAELDEVAGRYPWPPPMGLKSAFRPGGLVETMYKRVSSYSVKGIIYYQGEEDTLKNLEYYSATGMNTRYEVLLRELICQYRELSGDEKLPIVIVQLPMFIEREKDDSRDWAYLRAAQEKVAVQTEGVEIVSLIDTGDYDDVHPADKRTPGTRIALNILSKIYGLKDDGAADMCLRTYRKEDAKLILSFSNTYGCVNIFENKLLDIRREGTKMGHLYGFEVICQGAGSEESVIPEAVIQGDEIVLKLPDGAAVVRYAFFNYGKVNIYNGKDMPLRPFVICLSPK